MTELPYGNTVDVYWNLHKGMWSIRHNGLVVGREPEVHLTWVEFRVQPGGRARVLKEGRKNVHAWARGILVRPSRYKGEQSWDARVSYNPYKAGHFTDTYGNHVQGARVVKLDSNRAVWAMGLGYGVAPSKVITGAP